MEQGFIKILEIIWIIFYTIVGIAIAISFATKGIITTIKWLIK